MVFSTVTESRIKPTPMTEQMQRQLSHYWRVRITKTIERLEREARRMLQIEEELSAFATRYYEAVGDAVSRLAALEQKASPATQQNLLPELPEVMAQRETRAVRRIELKSRYRSLAKEIHPDRAMVVDGAGTEASNMHRLNAAYQHGDLAALLKLEAQLTLNKLGDVTTEASPALEEAVRDVERAADTYAEGYRALLGSPLNELMLRAMSARLAGWDWMEAVVRKIERTIEEKERELVQANINAISEWREGAVA